jgi:hypothetical protein
LLKGAFLGQTVGGNSLDSPVTLLSAIGARLKPNNGQLEARRESGLCVQPYASLV